MTAQGLGLLLRCGRPARSSWLCNGSAPAMRPFGMGARRWKITASLPHSPYPAPLAQLLYANLPFKRK